MSSVDAICGGFIADRRRRKPEGLQVATPSRQLLKDSRTLKRVHVRAAMTDAQEAAAQPDESPLAQRHSAPAIPAWHLEIYQTSSVSSAKKATYNLNSKPLVWEVPRQQLDRGNPPAFQAPDCLARSKFESVMLERM